MKFEQTGWLHCGLEIPLYENLLYILKLLRERTVEGHLLAKEKLNHLLQFRVGDNFPKKLHEFPKCYHNWQVLDLLLPLYWIDYEFPKLGLKGLVVELLEISLNLDNLPPAVDLKRKALAKAMGKDIEISYELMRDEDYLFNLIIALQPLPQSESAKLWSYIADGWSDNIMRYIGDRGAQSGYEKKLSLLERLLRKEEPSDPSSLPLLLVSSAPPITGTASLTSPVDEYWGDADQMHSLALFHKPQVEIQGNLASYGEEIPPLDNIDSATELSLYLDAKEPATFTVSGKSVSTFGIGERCQITTPSKRFTLAFELASGEGEFRAHIRRGNRPTQTLKDGEAYDWAIGLKTLRRDSCSLRLTRDCS